MERVLSFIRNMLVPLATWDGTLAVKPLQGALLKGDIPNEYPPYKVQKGVDYQGYHPKGTTIFPMRVF